MDTGTILLLAWLALPVPFLITTIVVLRKLKRARKETAALKERFGPVVSVEEERAKVEAQIAGEKAEAAEGIVTARLEAERNMHEIIQQTEAVQAEIVQVRATYAEKRKHLTALQEQIAVYDERLAFAELGVYEPHFDFGDSKAYKDTITTVRGRQKDYVSNKIATQCPTDWTVDGSKSKGQTMINRQSRLTLRAFNGECEAAIANTRWNNVVAMEKRIRNAAKQIDSANASMNLTINPKYLELKVEELRLTHEYREQLKIEKEERAEMARAEREEKKLLAEAAAAEKKEAEYQKLLDKARLEAGTDEARIAELEAQLAEAHAASERARAMAEMTKSGYVYIISNIGSFGEDVVKIGLTRRLEPDDRVKELGDASVPFGFDTHAMIYSEEAPALENALHREFAERRINMSNMRKEFLRVSLKEVEEAVGRLAPDASFFTDREAQEYQETLARRRESLEAQIQQDKGQLLPAEI
ncbi:DUF4041 domain-containing protein [Leisingera aquaemixtae]|uniref:DUF4041 domain-containing protein n=1 Tax=Leisingera aquaemixtae TaxID=1396826 RepID=A0ABY5WJJ2_9RHOB|nr:DUF4041 domain-containing protein [Leisingera aquaemixtae]UWQ41633.1 DUF4041 domain-containing protein [Leisingera aquaemixtae]